MVKEIQLRITLQEEKESDILVKKSAEFFSIPERDITGIKVLRKSIDARKKLIILNYKVAVYIKEPLPDTSDYTFDYKDVSNAKPIHIIGFGPAGMYAALRCIELGFKPIVLERGKNVQDRRRDLKAINQEHFVNEDYQKFIKSISKNPKNAYKGSEARGSETVELIELVKLGAS